MRDSKCWIPELVLFSDYENEWFSYEKELYRIFKKDFIDSHPIYQGLPVNIRKHPIEFDKEEAFFHITCKDYTHTRDRKPDLNRCERIKWPKPFIEEICLPFCDNCKGTKTWSESEDGKTKVYILLPEERYIVILEKRDKYYLLITAFYIEHEHYLGKMISKYRKYSKQQKTPS